MVSQMDYLPAPSGAHVSASGGFAGFEIYTPAEIYQNLQTSEKTSLSKKHKAPVMQDSDSPTSVTTSSSVFPSSSTASTSVNSSNLPGEEKRQRKSRG